MDNCDIVKCLYICGTVCILILENSLINILYISFFGIAKPKFGSNFQNFFFGPVHPEPWHKYFWFLWSSHCFENSHKPKVSKSVLPNLYYAAN